MKNVRTVIWDCDNVMWFHKKEEAEIIAKELGIIESEEFKEELHKMFDAFMKEFKENRVSMKTMINIIEKEMPVLNAYNITPEEFLEAKRRVKLDLIEFNEDSLVVLKYFTDNNIKNVIKSDWLRMSQEKVLKSYRIMQYIERIYCCDDSYLKSNPKSISEIIKSGREDEYVIIGDSLTSDISFAHNAGIKSIWFNPQGKENYTPYSPTIEVKSLLEVMNII